MRYEARSFVKAAIGTLCELLEIMGRLPSRLYLGIYLAIIFSFSGIYYILPGPQFYHSTARYEYDVFNEDANRVLADLQANIKTNLFKHDILGQPTTSGWKLDTDRLLAYNLNVAEFPEQFSFEVSVPMSYVNPDFGEMRSVLRTDVIVPTANWYVTEGEITLFVEMESTPLEATEHYPAEPNPDVLFPFTRGEGTSNAVGPVLAIPVVLYEDIVGIGQGYRGFPGGVSRRYERMLYFSAGVSTSNVFGDIAPLTRTTRLLVTSQALLSLMVVGLFLNALAHTVAANTKNMTP